jgi:2'-5' RNA ligase
LAALQSAIEQACRPFTSECEERNFTGHITIGRAKSFKRSQAEVVLRTASGLGLPFFGEWTATAIELMRSELSQDGARHTSLAAVPLATTRSR